MHIYTVISVNEAIMENPTAGIHVDVKDSKSVGDSEGWLCEIETSMGSDKDEWNNLFEI